MNFDEYQRIAITATPFDSDPTLTTLGLRKNVGKVTAVFEELLSCAHFACDHFGDKTVITNQLGDVLWYVAVFAYFFGVALDDVVTANVEKLQENYIERWTRENPCPVYTYDPAVPPSLNHAAASFKDNVQPSPTSTSLPTSLSTPAPISFENGQCDRSSICREDSQCSQYREDMAAPVPRQENYLQFAARTRYNDAHQTNYTAEEFVMLKRLSEIK